MTNEGLQTPGSNHFLLPMSAAPPFISFYFIGAILIILLTAMLIIELPQCLLLN